MLPVRRFLRLPSSERRLLAFSASLLVLSRVGLRVVSFQRLWEATRKVGNVSHGRLTMSDDSSTQITLISEQVRRAARFIPGATCLPQALTGYLLMQAYGIDTTLRIGVRKDGSNIEAHAWLERNGDVVLGGKDSPDEFNAFDGLEEVLSDAKRDEDEQRADDVSV